MKSFGVLSWNIEHFRKPKSGRLARIVQIIKSHSPDVFALYEVENVDILKLMQDHFSDFDFHITDGPQVQEILVGHRRNHFDQVVFTQKREFQVGNPHLRPGALLSVRVEKVNYHLLFMHTDSGVDASAFGNRFEMFAKAGKLIHAIGKQSKDGSARLVILGDLNTMGLEYPRPGKKFVRISANDEIQSIGEPIGLKALTKEFELTFFNGKIFGNLDHILTTPKVKVATLGMLEEGKAFQVKVAGWHSLADPLRKDFVENVSDHCLLFCRIEV